MSRIGNMPITIPAGVEFKVDKDNTVTVKGPKGELTQKLSTKITIENNDGTIVFKRGSNDKDERALHGLSRALVNNMIIGVTNGFQKKLQLVGVGYKAEKKGDTLVLSLGYSHPVEMVDPEGLEAVCEGQNKIIVKGIDKQKVGQMAAVIRGKRPPEPYHGKGVKYTDERIRRKAGKTGKGK